MINSTRKQSGFTVIEVLVFIVVIAIIGTVAALNIRDYRASQRDIGYKRDINNISYQLEVFYEKNRYYPAELNDEFKKGIDKAILADEMNVEIGQPNARYKYRPYECTDAKCKSYVLETPLELESTYRKNSLNN